MRFRLALQALAESEDANGQRIENWADVGTYWGSLAQLSGREALNADRLKITATHKATLRYSGVPIDATMRLRFGSRFLAIESANNVDERNRTWELMVVETKNPS